jgi:hypothetical protein
MTLYHCLGHVVILKDLCLNAILSFPQISERPENILSFPKHTLTLRASHGILCGSAIHVGSES